MLATMLTAFSVLVSADVVTGDSLEQQVAKDDMADAYSIYTAADYVYFFNNKDTFAGCTMNLENDIDLNPGWEAKRVVTTNTTPAGPGPDGVDGTDDDVAASSTTTYSVDKTGLTTELKIEASSWFKGMDADNPAVFNGKGHTVKGVYVEGIGGNEGAGVIGRVQNAIIKDVFFENCATISLKDEGATVGGRVGGIVTIAKTNVTFENVAADIIVTGNGNTGGFVALNMNDDTTAVTYNNCVSVCDVLSLGTSAGGFVGNSWDRSASTFTNCAFYGKVEAVESTSGSDPRAVGMFAGSTSAGTSGPAAKANLNSRVTLSNCIGAGEVICNKEWNGAFVGYTFFHSSAVTDANTGEITGYTSNIKEANSAGKTQYINIAITNCIYVGFDKAIGDNVDKANILGTAATFNCDAKYVYTPTAVEKVELTSLVGANAVLKVDGSFDLTTDWVAVADSLPMPKALVDDDTTGGDTTGGDTTGGNTTGGDTTNSGNTNTNDTTTTAAPETTAPGEEKKGCGNSIGLAGIALVAAVATVGVVSKKRED